MRTTLSPHPCGILSVSVYKSVVSTDRLPSMEIRMIKKRRSSDHLVSIIGIEFLFIRIRRHADIETHLALKTTDRELHKPFPHLLMCHRISQLNHENILSICKCRSVAQMFY